MENLSFRFESDAFPGAQIDVVSFRVAEGLNEPFTADIEINLHEDDADLSSLVGKDGTLTIHRFSVSRKITGIVRSVLPRSDGARSPGLALELVPALWTLSLRRDTRMFQEKTAPEILRAVLEEGLAPYGRQIRLELEGDYPRREYCLQYQETDLAFAHRLMEEEGISYAFDQEGDVEVMVLRDRNSAFAQAQTLGGDGAVELGESQGGARESIHALRRAIRSTTTSVTVRDFDWTLGGYIVDDREEGEDNRGRDRESYEHGLGRELRVFSYSAGPRRYQRHDAAPQKASRREAHAVDDLIAYGAGPVLGFSAGTTFTLSGHVDPEADGEYLITRVNHYSQQAGGAGDTDRYHNSFECIPKAVPYRPKRATPRPHIDSIQTAVVTGPGGEEIHVDEHGRIKVQFHWDRENPADETSSCWIRVQQAWAGGGWGFWWVPRIGMEVLVQFVDGDPDRPLVTGTVYNGTNALPYDLPAEKTKSTIKSNSSLGGGGFNELRFEDRAGSEEIYAHAQKDYNEVVEHDHNTLVHNDQTNTVDVNQTQVVGANQTETVHGNQQMTVDGNRTVHVKSNFTENVDGTETRHVVGNVTETFGANEERTVLGNVTETIGANETRTISASQSYTIGGSQTLTIAVDASDAIAGAMSESVTGGVTLKLGAALAVEAAAGWNFDAAGGITMVAPPGMSVLVAGGNKRADSFHQWISTMEKQTGGFKLEITGMGSDLIGLSTGFTNYSYSETGAYVDLTGVKLWKKITKGTFEGVVCEFGALKADPAQTNHT
jgi:type VI secretion system secreted protein VgrG